MYKLMKTVTEIIDTLRAEGYIHDFSLDGEKIIINTDDKKIYDPSELIIEKTERYEGDSNPSDNAIIYAFTAKDGKQGIILDAYGAYSDPKLASLIASIPVRETTS